MKKLFLLSLLFASCCFGQTLFDASSQLAARVANDGTTGTTINQLAKVNSSGNAINAGTTDTSLSVYVVLGGAGTTGNASLAVSGAVPCKFDASGGTAGHYVQASGSTAGRCHDAGATQPTSGWIVGMLVTSPAANSNGVVLLIQGINASTGGGSFTGGTLTSELILAAPTTGAASMNAPSGTAPTSPVAGDFWQDATGLEFFFASGNGQVEIPSNSATCTASDANTVLFGGKSNAAQVSENGAACQEIVQLTKTQTVQNKTFNSTDIGMWQSLCTASSTTSTIGCTSTVARKHYLIRLIIAGYSGGGGIARAQLGNTTTLDTGTNYAFGGFNIASGTSTAPTVSGVGSGSTAQSGCPVSGSATTAGRFVQMNVTNSGARIKYFTIETSGVGASAAVTPNLAHIGCTWNNTTDGVGIFQFQACTAINGACTTVNFTTGTTLTVWGRDDN